ncbi:MAG: hypothetical protein IJR87_03730, partial [Bacteroidaceae bacterium]|nr:hypothetical protein [Bacteroidaceae bacterium]
HHYADLQTGLAYNGKYEKVPVPRLFGPQKASISFSATARANVISWHDVNGEFNSDMWVERRKDGRWSRLETIAQQEEEANYTCLDTLQQLESYAYRVGLKTYTGKTMYSAVLTNTVSGSTPLTSDGALQIGTVHAESAMTTYFNYFSTNYAVQPAVVLGSPSNNNTSAAPCEQITTFSRDANGAYECFRFNYFPWTLESSKELQTAEKSTYIVAAPGSGTLSSLRYEAGYLDGNAATSTELSYTFSQSFEQEPVVLASAVYRYTSYPFLVRVHDVTKQGFKVTLQRQQGLDNVSGLQNQKATISFFAIEQGETHDDTGRLVRAGTQNFSMRAKDVEGRITFNEPLLQPRVLAQLQTLHRPEVIALVRLTLPTDDTSKEFGYGLTFDPTSTATVSGTQRVQEQLGWICISETEETVDIRGVEDQRTDHALYDLSGRLVSRQGSPVLLPKRGLYIINGKKILVK